MLTPCSDHRQRGSRNHWSPYRTALIASFLSKFPRLMGANSSVTIQWTLIPPILLHLGVTPAHPGQLNSVACRASLICTEGKCKGSQKLKWLIAWKTILPSVQRHSRKLYSSKSHRDKQAFDFYFHPALVCPVWDVKDAGISEVHTHSTRKVQDPRADTLVTLFKSHSQGREWQCQQEQKSAATSSEAKTSKGQLSSLTHPCCCLPSSLGLCYLVLPTMLLSHLHFAVQNQDNSPWLCALFARVSAKPRTRSEHCPCVSISFWFIRVVSAEQPNITDPMHSASNNLAIDQTCSVLLGNRGTQQFFI